MNFKDRILILTIVVIFISLLGLAYANNQGNMGEDLIIVNNTNDNPLFGCCSIVLQLEGNDTVFAYRRDSNVTADVFIEEVDWHGHHAIKQYKTYDGYFNHVIITSDGWVIGLGGIDDGVDNKKCENITAGMISDDYSISEEGLAKIQEINKPYGRGHVLIKAPNGNYGFSTVDKLKTGKLEPGRYISLPNNYSLSRGGNFSLGTADKVKLINELAQSDKYGLDRREIVTYDFKTDDLFNKTDVYVSNEDGSQLGVDYKNCIDDVYFNNTVIKSDDIPIAPHYKNIGSVTFIDQDSNVYKLILLSVLFGFVVFVSILYFIIRRIIRFVKYRIFR